MMITMPVAIPLVKVLFTFDFAQSLVQSLIFILEYIFFLKNILQICEILQVYFTINLQTF